VPGDRDSANYFGLGKRAFDEPVSNAFMLHQAIMQIEYGLYIAGFGGATSGYHGWSQICKPFPYDNDEYEEELQDFLEGEFRKEFDQVIAKDSKA